MVDQDLVTQDVHLSHLEHPLLQPSRRPPPLEMLDPSPRWITFSVVDLSTVSDVRDIQENFDAT